MNQLYTHMAAFMLAKALGVGAELVLPPAFHRGAFGSKVSKSKWRSAPVEDLLDVEAIKGYWSNNSLLIHTVIGLVNLTRCPSIPTTVMRSWD